MNAREAILHSVRAARPAPVSLPSGALADERGPASNGDLADRFCAAVEASGAALYKCSRADLGAVVRRIVDDAGQTVSLVDGVVGTLPSPDSPHAYDGVDVFVCEGALAVAENGAIWLPASRLGHRAGLFLSTRIVIVVESRQLVKNLHDMYDRIDIASDEFGVLVCGPSKTADIEQAMVIGAHGPKGVAVILIDPTTAGGEE